MPEINPLTNNQIFLKKIAENTGSNYETGDVSEINPLTIDQIFLKEIAANTAGQSGDISELEGKVADNTSAISAIVNVTGAKNVLPDTYKSQTIQDVTFTKNVDGSIAISGANSSSIWANFFVINDIDFSLGVKVSDIFPCAGKYIITSEGNTQTSDIHNDLMIADVINETIPSGTEIEITDAMMSKDIRMSFSVAPNAVISTPVTIKPMIRPAGTDPIYVPYAMTNRELTERTNIQPVTIEPISPNNLEGSTLSVVNGVLVGSVCFFRTDSTDYLLRQWMTVAHTSLRLSQPIQTSLYSEAEGLSGGLMNIGTNGDIMVFQNYYDPTGTVTKRGASGMFSTPI